MGHGQTRGSAIHTPYRYRKVRWIIIRWCFQLGLGVTGSRISVVILDVACLGLYACLMLYGSIGPLPLAKVEVSGHEYTRMNEARSEYSPFQHFSFAKLANP